MDSKLKGTLQKNMERSNSNKNIINKEPMFEAVTEIDNSELTDKQRLFCIYYIKHFNATKAAIKAEYSKESARFQGSWLLTDPNIVTEIQRIKTDRIIEQKVFLLRINHNTLLKLNL